MKEDQILKNENNVIDINEKISKESEDTKNTSSDFLIKTATPYKIIFNNKNGKDIATLILLCRDKDDKLFVIDKNYILGDSVQKEIVECIPFSSEDTDFGNEKICTNLVLNYLDNYVITDKNFYIAKNHLLDINPMMTITLTNVKTKEDRIAEINPDTFAAISFIFSYIEEAIINEHDLALATIIASREKLKTEHVEFFEVCDIEKIVAMAPANCDLELRPNKSLLCKIKSLFERETEVDHNTSIGIVLKLSRYKDNNKDIVQLLAPFDIGVEFEDSKFKGATISDIENEYFEDGDQYMSTLITHNVTIDGLDKTYMMIRGKSKNGDIKLFLLDSTIVKDLKEKINAY